MKYEMAFNELTYTGFKVLIYCLKTKDKSEWTHIGYGRWLGLEYKAASARWKDGTQDLLEKGYLNWSEGKLTWGKKVLEFLGKEEKKS